MNALLRGRIYRARIPGVKSDKYFVVVSNNARNRALGTALAVRLTTSSKPSIASIVELPAGEVMGGGRAVCDDIVELWDDDVKEDVGAVSAQTMRAIDDGLKAALGLR